MHIMIYTHTCTVSGSSRAYLEATGEYSEMYIHTIYMYDSYVYIWTDKHLSMCVADLKLSAFSKVTSSKTRQLKLVTRWRCYWAAAVACVFTGGCLQRGLIYWWTPSSSPKYSEQYMVDILIHGCSPVAIWWTWLVQTPVAPPRHFVGKMMNQWDGGAYWNQSNINNVWGSS